MTRRLPFAALAVALVACPAPALVAPFSPPLQRALAADVVCVGKVTAIEKDSVDAAPFPGAPNKVAHKIAVVKIETPLAGAAGVTHLKVGFVPAPPQPPRNPGVAPPPIRRPGPRTPELKEGEEFVLFLTRHPSGDFYVMPTMSPPIPAGTDEAKKDVERIKKAIAALADPMKGLKSDKADERYFTATTLVTKYRTYPAGKQAEQTPVAAEESQLILKGLLDGDWAKFDADMPNGMRAFASLGITAKDGWAQPKPKPGNQAENYNNTVKEAFAAWLAGPGKTYQIKKVTAKK